MVPAGPQLSRLVAQTTVTRPTIEPTLRSIPPVTTTRVVPRATTPMMEDCTTISRRLSTLENEGFRAVKTANTAASATSTPATRPPEVESQRRLGGGAGAGPPAVVAVVAVRGAGPLVISSPGSS